MLKNSKSLLVTKLKNSNSDKTQKLKLRPNTYITTVTVTTVTVTTVTVTTVTVTTVTITTVTIN